ncbi:hypothetical protein L2750_05550 [Shewanella submarina]|uniref:Uncharacterized protein n=1 Tax=Shewanella submarina TaxID=2016376 RepID=A0ABV7G919_9GAMM|nr:hypothetical protein [Shewanella submarina]MCL1036616.1 hypothetical protein [Shewanella submarina]
MEAFTIYLILGCIHALFAFYVSALVIECPFRQAGTKFLLFCITVFIPFIGPAFVKYNIGFIPIKNSSGTGNVGYVTHAPDSNSGSSSDSFGDSGGGGE